MDGKGGGKFITEEKERRNFAAVLSQFAKRSGVGGGDDDGKMRPSTFNASAASVPLFRTAVGTLASLYPILARSAAVGT